MATQQFCIVFLQRYCSDGVTMAPPFSTCSLDTALSLSVGTSQVCDVSCYCCLCSMITYLFHDYFV
ncbi:unnamed protein product [Trichobilharzia regenti]|nr:unnamed protein product [Trichobilharzia regenti]